MTRDTNLKHMAILAALVWIMVFIGGCATTQVKNPAFCKEDAKSAITDVANKLKMEPDVFWNTFVNVNTIALRVGPKGSIDVAYGIADNLYDSLIMKPNQTYYDFIHLVLQNGQYLNQYVNSPAGIAAFTVGKIALGLMNYDIPISECDYLQFLWAVGNYKAMLEREFPRDSASVSFLLPGFNREDQQRVASACQDLRELQNGTNANPSFRSETICSLIGGTNCLALN